MLEAGVFGKFPTMYYIGVGKSTIAWLERLQEGGVN
jgi:hypothetical protein